MLINLFTSEFGALAIGMEGREAAQLHHQQPQCYFLMMKSG
jgi:hypothetical protein